MIFTAGHKPGTVLSGQEQAEFGKVGKARDKINPTHEEIYEILRKVNRNPKLTRMKIGHWEVHIEKNNK
jgi:hypothetical protein